MKLLHVVGARPNFMKLMPVYEACRIRAYRQTVVHTGQHYDHNMSRIFFDQLGLPRPDLDLGVGSGSHAEQTARIMTKFDGVLSNHRPDWVLVYGDVNSTVAAALVCAKRGIRVAHVEAGLRSFDRTMPEEINRLVTDQLADLLFTPSRDANRNLLREGISKNKIRFVGNVMIDTLIKLLPLARRTPVNDVPADFVLVTLHRPSNVDEETQLRRILTALRRISRKLPVIFPVHPRTRERIGRMNGRWATSALRLIEPLGYLEFLHLQERAKAVVTDSGGIQEEATHLGVPCLTLRENTERPVTVTQGSNRLIGRDTEKLEREVDRILASGRRRRRIPPLWDGRAAERIATNLKSNP